MAIGLVCTVGWRCSIIRKIKDKPKGIRINIFIFIFHILQLPGQRRSLTKERMMKKLSLFLLLYLSLFRMLRVELNNRVDSISEI